MHKLKIRQLETFLVYMKTGSVTEAAKELNTTQPNASKTLKQIEDAVGLTLFARTGGKLRPTPEAELLAEHVGRLMHQIDLIETFGVENSPLRKPTLRIATLATFGVSLLPTAIEQFRSSSPGLRIQLDVVDAEKIHTMVAQGLYDFGFVHYRLPRGIRSGLFSVVARAGGKPLTCCSPGKESGAAGKTGDQFRRGESPTARKATSQLVAIPGGTFKMGYEGPEVLAADGESPVREVEIAPFRLAPTTVTNARFAAFVKETGYISTAEKHGWSFVFHLFLPKRVAASALAPVQTPWWRKIEGACWRMPEGPGSSIDARMQHPAVHISLEGVRIKSWTVLHAQAEALTILNRAE